MPVVLFTELVLSVVLLPGCWRIIRWKIITPMLLAAGLVAPVGVYILTILDESVTQLLVSAVILLFVLKIILNRSQAPKETKHSYLIAGGLSGLFGGMTGMTGPPVAGVFIRNALDPNIARASMIAYFVVIDSWLLVSVFLQAELNRLHLITSGGIILPLLIGAYVGTRLFPLATAKTYKVIALTIISLAALISPVMALA